MTPIERAARALEDADQAFGLSLRQVGVWQRMIDALLAEGE